MRRRFSSAAFVAALMLLEPVARTPDSAVDAPIRLERITVPGRDARPMAIRPIGERIGHDIPLDGDGKHLIVEGTLNDAISGPMLIDTGASYCVLTSGTAARLGLTSKGGASVPVATANGRVDADLVRIEAMQLRGARLTQVDAVILDAVEPPLIGIVGLSFLTQFRFSVDPVESTLHLER